MKKKIICFDLDGVICETNKNHYEKSVPNKKIIKSINNLYEKDFFIKIFTARFMGRNKENRTKARKQGYIFTKRQIKSWGLKFHELIMGKPSYDIYVDDKCYNVKDNWKKKIEDLIN